MGKVWRAAWWAGCIAWAILVNALSCWGPQEVLSALTGQTAAAWVQALGSIAAIVGSIYLTRWQDSRIVAREELLASEEKRAWLLGVANTLHGALNCASEARGGLGNREGVKSYFRFREEQVWTSLQELIDQIDVNRTGDSTLSQLLVNARSTFRRASSAIAVLAASIDEPRAEQKQIAFVAVCESSTALQHAYVTCVARIREINQLNGNAGRD